MTSSVGKVHSESWGPLVQITMEIQDRIDIQIRKPLISTFPNIAQRASDKEVCPLLVSNTKRSWRGGLDYALAKSMKRRDSHALDSLIRDRYTHPREAVFHLLGSFVRECYCEDVSRRNIALQEITDPSDQGASLARTGRRNDKISLIVSNSRLPLSRVELQLIDKQLRVLSDCSFDILVIVPDKILTQQIRSNLNRLEILPHGTIMGSPDTLPENRQGQLSKCLDL